MPYIFNRECDYKNQKMKPGDPLLDPQNWYNIKLWVNARWIKKVTNEEYDELVKPKVVVEPKVVIVEHTNKAVVEPKIVETKAIVVEPKVVVVEPKVVVVESKITEPKVTVVEPKAAIKKSKKEKSDSKNRAEQLTARLLLLSRR